MLDAQLDTIPEFFSKFIGYNIATQKEIVWMRGQFLVFLCYILKNIIGWLDYKGNETRKILSFIKSYYFDESPKSSSLVTEASSEM